MNVLGRRAQPKSVQVGGLFSTVKGGSTLPTLPVLSLCCPREYEWSPGYPQTASGGEEWKSGYNCAREIRLLFNNQASCLQPVSTLYNIFITAQPLSRVLTLFLEYFRPLAQHLRVKTWHTPYNKSIGNAGSQVENVWNLDTLELLRREVALSSARLLIKTVLPSAPQARTDLVPEVSQNHHSALPSLAYSGLPDCPDAL